MLFAVMVPRAATLATLPAVLAYWMVVAVTAVMMKEPLKVASTPATVTDWPTT